MRIFFKGLYGPFAWSYDLVSASVSLGRWNGWVLTLLEDLDGEHILELGYGPGHLQLAARRKGLRIFGLDASKQMARIAYKRLQNGGFRPLILNGYAQFMPFASETFDQVVATFPSEYFYETDSLAEIYRLTKPQGEVLVLPVAWILGDNLPDRLARYLFSATHQASDPEDAELDQLIVGAMTRAGFEASFERRALPDKSQLLIVRGRKARHPSKL